MEFTTNTIGSTIFQSLLVLREDCPDDFVIKMLTHNEIDGLLKISVIQKNYDLDVRYNVTSLLPLSQVMQEALSKNKVLTIIRSIAKAAQNVEEYMLDSQGLLLDEKHIYVNIVNGETSLIYLPVENPYATDVVGYIKQLMTAFQYDTNEDSGYVLKMMNAFNSGSVHTVRDLIDLIEKIEKNVFTAVDKSSVPAVQRVATPSEEKREVTPEIPKAVPEVKRNVIPNIPVKPAEEVVSKTKSSLFGKAIAPKGEKIKPEKVRNDKPKNKLFGGKSEEKVEQARIPVRIPGEAVAVPAFVAEIPKQQDESFKESDISGKPLTPQEESMVQQKTELPNLMRDYGNTIVMNENNSTVTCMLDDIENNDIGTLRASVTRISNNQKMYIEKNILKMGKESDYVDFYIGSNPTISRSHADIICEEEKYYVRDNNSKNHTYVNGQQITPGTLVPLENNTEIKLSNEVFVFKLS